MEVGLGAMKLRSKHVCVLGKNALQGRVSIELYLVVRQTGCFSQNERVAMKSRKLVRESIAGLIILLATGQLNCFAEERSVDEKLQQIPVPQIQVFQGRMDVSADEVIGWMDEIEARLDSSKFDCRIKAEISSVTPRKDQQPLAVSWLVALRRAKSPAQEAERYIVVQQNLLDNLAIATNTGIAQDNRQHYDFLRLGEKGFTSSVTAFDYHASEIRSDSDWGEAKNALRLFMVFDPVRACTASPMDIENGYALEASSHSVRKHTVKAVVQEQDYVHILLELPVAKSTSKRYRIQTFKEKVPVQYLAWDDLQKESGMPEYTKVTRSVWRTVGEGENGQLLPYRIKGMVDLPYHVGDMEIGIAWTLEDSVDDRLFETTSLGKLAPANDVVFGAPLRINDLLEEALR
jgi:hypothetical protein